MPTSCPKRGHSGVLRRGTQEGSSSAKNGHQRRGWPKQYTPEPVFFRNFRKKMTKKWGKNSDFRDFRCRKRHKKQGKSGKMSEKTKKESKKLQMSNELSAQGTQTGIIPLFLRRASRSPGGE